MLTAGMASLLARCAFWVLLLAGLYRGELGRRTIIVFVVLWLVGLFGSSYVMDGVLFVPYVVILDVVLVLMVFKGDVKIG
jgi:hypothetical protein